MKARCNAELELGDDFGDNSTTFHCHLKRGHPGNHVEKGDGENPYTITWEVDSRITNLTGEIVLLTEQSQCSHEVPEHTLENGKVSIYSWCEICGLEFHNRKPSVNVAKKLIALQRRLSLVEKPLTTR